MARRRWWIAAAAGFVLFLGLASAGYDRYVIARGVDRARVAGLIVSTAPTGFAAKPTASNAVTGTADPFTTFQATARRWPSRTGAWTVSWGRPGSSTDSATILVSYLPSAADAARVQAEAVSHFTGPGSFQQENYALAQAVPVPGVPGAKGAVYTARGTARTPPVTAVVLSAGRAQALLLLGRTGTPAAAGAAAAALAQQEFRHLRAALPTFSLGVTRVPVLASALYWAAVAGIAALGIGIPIGLGRARRRREERRARTAHRQHQVRGSKIARRQATRRR